jgi:hypothetical protein
MTLSIVLKSRKIPLNRSEAIKQTTFLLLSSRVNSATD